MMVLNLASFIIVFACNIIWLLVVGWDEYCEAYVGYSENRYRWLTFLTAAWGVVNFLCFIMS